MPVRLVCKKVPREGWHPWYTGGILRSHRRARKGHTPWPLPHLDKKFDLLRRLLHSTDNKVKNKAKEEYIKYIDQVMSASHGLFSLDMNTDHTCTHCAASGSIDTMYKNWESNKKSNDSSPKDNQPLQDARHKSKCHQIDGKVMQCKACDIPERPADIVSNSLKKLKVKLGSNVPIPIPCNLLNVSAYRFGYNIDMTDSRGEYKVINENNKDSFWNDPKARAILLRICFDEHCYLHARSCFKKGCECRFFFPFMAQIEDTQLFEDSNKKETMFYIHS